MNKHFVISIFILLGVVNRINAQDPTSDSLRRELRILEFKLRQMELNQATYPNSSADAVYDGYSKLTQNRWAKYYNAKNNFTLNGFAIFVGGLELGYERVFNNHIGLRFIGGYYTSENPPYENSNYMEGFRGEVQARLYLEDGANNTAGIPFFLVSASYKSIYVRQDQDQFFSFPGSTSVQKSSAAIAYPSVLFGYKKHIYKGFFTEITAGISYNFVLDESSSQSREIIHIPIVNPYTSATQFRSTFVVGVTF